MKFKAEKDFHRSAEQYYLTLRNLAVPIQQFSVYSAASTSSSECYFSSQYTFTNSNSSSNDICCTATVCAVSTTLHICSQALEAFPNTAKKT